MNILDRIRARFLKPRYRPKLRLVATAQFWNQSGIGQSVMEKVISIPIDDLRRFWEIKTDPSGYCNLTDPIRFSSAGWIVIGIEVEKQKVAIVTGRNIPNQFSDVSRESE